MLLLMIFLLTVLLAVLIVAVMSGKGGKAGDYRKTELLSPAEKRFFRILDAAAGSGYRVFSKVRIADIITPCAGNRSEWQTLFNRISAKHVDFVLCGKDSLEVECVIELDDRSHNEESRAARDVFVNQAFEAAGVPVLRFPVLSDYSESEITASIDGIKAPLDIASGKRSLCPKCGKNLVLRTAGSGARAGSKFWGCSGYPECRFIRNIP